MKDHFNDEARNLWNKAELIAQDLNETLGPAHLFIAFLQSEHDLALELKARQQKPLSEVIKLTKSKMASFNYIDGVTNELRKQIQKEANLSFSPTVNIQHILRAVLGHDYEDYRSVPRQVLAECGIDLGWLMKQVWRMKATPKAITESQHNSQSEAVALAETIQSSGTIISSGGKISTPLDKYGREITRLVREAKIDPVAPREKEIMEVEEILCRRVKSNPLLVGEPGVGKSAILIGLAQRIVEGAVPEKLKNLEIFELNLTSIIAGASLQGEFEKRMTTILDFVKANRNIILFIDEIHGLIGTGGQPGLGDAANILKTPLINGDFRCIGATTMKEYRKYIEKDPGLARRFQTVEIDEPSVEESVRIISSIKYLYEDFHKVILSEDIIRKAVEMSQLYIRDHYLPDKAIDLIDQTCAHVSLRAHEEQLPKVTDEDLISIISHKTKLPLDKITSDKMQSLLELESRLKKRVIGQDGAIAKLGDIIRMTKSRLDLKPVRPDGVFLFVGPTGVGKTELARVLAEQLFSDENKIIRLDMSEFMEAHSVSKLIGSPPGYVGSDQEGGLTGKVRTDPYSIILLDEVEKAHPDVLNLFLQVFEDGRLTDSQGRTVYFSNTTIIMTSNLGAAKVFQSKRGIGFNEGQALSVEQSESAIMEAVRKHFTPEFLNRIDEVVYFKPLSKEVIMEIGRLKLGDIRTRFAQEGKEIVFDGTVLALIGERGYNPEYGARFLNRTIETLILKPLSKTIISKPLARKLLVTTAESEIIIREEGE